HTTLAQWDARVIRWSCTDIRVSRGTHYAGNNLTGDTPGRASPDARGSPPYAVRVSAGVPYFTAVCGWPKPDGDCHLPVLLTLQCVPDRASVSCWEPRCPDRRRWSALDRCPDDGLDAVAHALPRGLTQSRAACVWVVPHPLELCDPR